jgi:streptogramin lyase
MPTRKQQRLALLATLALSCATSDPATPDAEDSSGADDGADDGTTGAGNTSDALSSAIATIGDDAASDSTSSGSACGGPTNTTPPVAEPVALAGEAASFDDILYSAELGQVIAIPQGRGVLHLVDPDSLAVTSFAGFPTGIASADASNGRIFVLDRSGEQVLVVDPADGTTVGVFALSAHPDYVRVSPATAEVWVTEPGSQRIEVLTVEGDVLAHAADIATEGGPEGVAFDVGRRRAYIQRSGGAIAAIDVDARMVVDTWPSGCGSSHGIPVVDEARGLVFAGCSSGGGGAMLDSDDGTLLASHEAGGGAALLAYAPALGHFYLRGDPGSGVAMLAVCGGSELALLGTAMTTDHGHGMVADDRGNLWVCDADNGGILRLRDPWPGD